MRAFFSKTNRPTAAFRRIAAFAVSVFFLHVVVPVYAVAGKWRQNEIKWHLTSVGSPTSATAIFQRDTTFNVVAGNAADTTGNFSLSDADVWPGNGFATGSADTVVVGFLVIQSDTAVSTASTVTSVTYEIDGRAGGFGSSVVNSQWTQVDSMVVNIVADAAAGGVISLPVLARSNLFLGTQGAGAVSANSYYRLMAYGDLRCRLTAVTGIMPQARVFWRYWEDD